MRGGCGVKQISPSGQSRQGEAAAGRKISHATHDARNAKDQYAPVNATRLVISDETVLFNNTPGTWRKITSRGADSDEIFITLTNEIALPPGILSEVYRLRWKIEKAFDQQERKLDEGNAWATSDTAKEIQAIAICLAHNLLQILRATLALLRPLMLKYV